MTEFVNSVQDSEKNKVIRQEIDFQKLLHPLDAKERSTSLQDELLGSWTDD